MKIEKIRLLNLNSLAGEWVVDFTAPAIAADGIFAITGQTGAGKSTILDAICLALYGATPRLGRIAGENEIMHRGTGECAAEVTFTTARGRYRAHWSQKRARGKANGKLQGAKHEIVDDASNTVLAHKLREAEAKIAEITGMSFEQFTRAMLLAQGAFASFLLADANERGAMLEKITGTAIYSAISQRAYQRSKDEKQKLALLLAEQGGITLYSEDEEAALSAAQTAAQAAAAALADDAERLRTAVRQREQELRLQTAAAALQAAKNEADHALVAFAPAAARLDAARRANESSGEAASLLQLQQAQAKDRSGLTAADAAAAAAQTALAAVQQRRTDAQAELNACMAKRTAAQPLLAQIRELDSSLTVLQEAAAAAQAGSDKAAALAGSRAQALETAQARLAQLQTEAAGTAAKLDAAAADAKLADDYSALAARLTQFAELTEQRRAAEAAVETHDIVLAAAAEKMQTAAAHADKAHDALQARPSGDAAEWEAAAAGLSALLPDLEKREALNAEIAERLQKTAALNDDASNALLLQMQAKAVLQDAEKQRQDADLAFKEMLLAQQAADLAAQRAQLQDGKPCPLCGALEHPYRGVHFDPPDRGAEQASAAALQAEKQAAAEAAAAERDAANAMAQLQAFREETEKLREKLAALGGAPHAGEADAMRKKLAEAQQELAAAKLWEADVHQAEKAAAAAAAELREAALAHGYAAEKAAALRQQAADAEAAAAVEETELTAILSAYGVALTDDAISILAAKRDCRKALEAASQRLAADIGKQEAAADAAAAASAEAEREAAAAAEQAVRAAERYAGVLAQRQALFGDKSVQAESGRLEAAAEAAQAAADAAQTAVQQAAAEAASAQTRRDALVQAIAVREAEITAAEAAYQSAVQVSGFADAAAREAALLSKDAIAALQAQAAQLQERAQTAAVQLQDNVCQQEELALLLADAAPLQVLRPQLAEAQMQLTALQQEIGVRSQQLAENSAKKAKLAAAAAAIAKQRRESEKWEKLNALIGSAGGDKFRVFVQGLTFEALVQHANRQLEKLSGRYLLLRGEDAPLSLFVLDGDQAGEIRPVKNLSGGESFIVSLALALGLSQMAGGNICVESLFLDEGFGTLDEETLEIALDTLAALPQEGKLIGIISHVPALKERIAAQIQVIRGHAGKSRIEGAGVVQNPAGG